MSIGQTSHVIGGPARRDAGQREPAPERSLGLAGSIVKARYRLNAVASVSRDVVVYTAEELRFGRPIALKVLRDEVARDAEFAAAVRDQATALAMSVHVHRGLPRVYECGTMDTGELFIALEPTKGPTLREVLDARGGLDPPTALRIASQIGEAIETLHHSRIVHGQLGPDSVLLVRNAHGLEHASLLDVELTAACRTTTGRRRGTASPPTYRAPEQLEGGEITEATDQYALGVLLRELLTGGRTTTSPLPPEIERIITTALDPRPERRFPDLSVMVNDMWAAQTALAEPTPPPRAVTARTSAPRRKAARDSRAALGIAAALATAGIIAVLVWLVLSGAMASRLRALGAAPARPATPVVQEATPPSAPPRVPASPSVPREERAALPAAHGVKSGGSPGEALAHPAAAPRPTPVVAREEPGATPVVDGGPPRAVAAPVARPTSKDPPATDRGDGSAIIDWLLKPRR